MKTSLETPMQHALNVVAGLDEEEQALLLDIVHQRRIESRRAEIAENARATALAFREGSTRLGTIEDLRRDLTIAFKPDPAGGEQLILLVDIGTHGEVY